MAVDRASDEALSEGQRVGLGRRGLVTVYVGVALGRRLRKEQSWEVGRL